jgi:hypothetical protein
MLMSLPAPFSGTNKLNSMKKILFRYLPLFVLLAGTSSCLKSNDYFEDFSSTQPTADIPKAKANPLAATATPTQSWFTLDSSAAGVDYATAVHIAAKEHVGDVTVRMKIDKEAAQKWLSTHPTYELLPDSLYTVPSTDVVIKNAGVFSTGDFIVRIKTGVRDPNTPNATVPTPKNIFKTHNFILPVSIDAVVSHPYVVESNFKTILWKINVK